MKRKLIGTSLWIEQDRDQAFNLDTILLQNFIKVPLRTKRVLDFGTGTGALMLYVSLKTNALIFGIEIQENRFLKAKKNIEMNQLTEKLECLHQDIRTLSLEKFKDVDLIVCNPPFFKLESHHKKNMSLEKTIARHEIELNLKSLAQSVYKHLKFGGSFQMIHRPERLGEIISIFSSYHLEIKRMKFVHPYIDKKPNHVLLEFIKNGKPNVIIESPLILYDAKHQMSETIKHIYGGD